MTERHARRPSLRPPLAVAAALTVASAHAEPPAHLEALQQELRVAEDVIEAALDNVPDLRVSGVEADYLAGQGVLISLSVSTGWPGSGYGRRVVRIIRDEDISVPMPEMVHEILADLELDLPALDRHPPTLGRHPPNLAPLRELRNEQRELRNQQRKVRNRIWAARLDAATGSDAGDAGTVAALEEEMQRLEAEEDALEERIDAEYERLASTREVEAVETVEQDEEARTGSASDGTSTPEFDTALARVVCDYGATLKSLPREERLSLRVRRHAGDTFHVFRFEDVIACQRGEMTPETLLDNGVSYEG